MMDFAKLKDFLRKQIAAYKSFADLTGLQWAQDTADRIEALFDGLFGPTTYGATCAATAASGDCIVSKAVQAAEPGLPAWLVPLLIQLGQEMLRRLFAKQTPAV